MSEDNKQSLSEDNIKFPSEDNKLLPTIGNTNTIEDAPNAKNQTQFLHPCAETCKFQISPLQQPHKVPPKWA